METQGARYIGQYSMLADSERGRAKGLGMHKHEGTCFLQPLLFERKKLVSNSQLAKMYNPCPRDVIWTDDIYQSQ